MYISIGGTLYSTVGRKTKYLSVICSNGIIYYSTNTINVRRISNTFVKIL